MLSRRLRAWGLARALGEVWETLYVMCLTCPCDTMWSLVGCCLKTALLYLLA